MTVCRAAAVALLLAWSASAAPAQSVDPNIGRSIVEEMSLLRTSPAQYAAILEQTLQYYVGNQLRRPGQIAIVTNEGAAAVREAINVLRAQSPLGALAYSEGLSRAAADHARDQGPTGRTGHTGQDGSTMGARISRYGRWGGSIAENIDYGAATARDVVISLVVDDGVSSRGHRTNILNPATRLAGAACGPHQVYRIMCVIDYAGEFTPN
jgi:uncharacterized protein YkwD